jgi:hypothetical protein
MRHDCFTVLVAVLLCSGSAAAQDADTDSDLPRVHYPVLVQHAASLAAFVPKGWGIEQKIQVDLNGDGAPDFVLVLQQKSPRNLIKNPDGLGTSEFDSNPRILMVLFADKSAGGYKRIAENHKLIPRMDAPTIDDPFTNIKAGKASFSVNIHSWANAGSWLTSDSSFTFRYQNGCIRLIGYDNSSRHRGTAQYANASVNYLTKKAKIVRGVDTDSVPDHPTTKWEALPADTTMPCLAEIGDGFEFQPPIPESDTDPTATDADRP